MGLINLVRNLWRYNSLDEELRQFANKGSDSVSNKSLQQTSGEGYEYPGGPISSIGLSSFNMFYNNYVNKAFKNEVDKIGVYRNMSQMPEIADVIEDAVIESTQENLDGDILNIDIIDEDLRKNENIVKNIEQEFEHLFYNKIKIANIIADLVRTYYVDGRLFYERLINRAKPSEGIIGIKKLPTETMDFEYDPKTLKITRVFQYLKDSAKRPDPGETEKDGVIIFHPEQIGFIDYGVYGRNRYDIIGYLDKCKIPYNQLKLLETSVIIYRIVRAPERLVFKIDVGQMPREKAIKYVEDQKNRMMKRPTYDPQSGALTNAPEIFSVQDNIFIPVSSEGGRGSDVTTVGGNPAGFAEMADINYFQRKLYKALKYPMSRVTAMEQHQESGIVFSNSPAGEIARDEIKWATFLSRHQTRFCDEMQKLFLLHLEFKGLKKQYELDDSKINITLNPPSFFKEKQEQLMCEIRFSNYLALANQPEMAKSFLMERYLDFTEEEIQANADALKADVEYGFKEAPMDMNPSTTPEPEEAPEPAAEDKPKSSGKLKAVNKSSGDDE
jgi:hypothetical protein